MHGYCYGLAFQLAISLPSEGLSVSAGVNADCHNGLAVNLTIAVRVDRRFPNLDTVIEMGVSRNRGTPKWMVYNGKPLLKWMIWGYHYFKRKHPNVASLSAGVWIYEYLMFSHMSVFVPAHAMKRPVNYTCCAPCFSPSFFFPVRRRSWLSRNLLWFNWQRVEGETVSPLFASETPGCDAC